MRILLITGGLYLLAVAPVTAQEATDSTRVLAVPASTPASPNMQELFVGAASMALVGLGLRAVQDSAGRGAGGALRCA